ncbi:unnamed protein product [Dovyalis caffra]|uniref:Uncharacterized protein n=1 Tax=Dovyalis caffra TaxID=77055 RepID=A0AAV1SY46_9ROSI|nr:unnamed protein product [Dovyalis caffra]
MSSESVKEDCLAWAARDPSGVLSPYQFSRSLGKLGVALLCRINAQRQQDWLIPNHLDFITDTASGEHPFDPYVSLLKTAGVFVLVGFPSELKSSSSEITNHNLIGNKNEEHTLFSFVASHTLK